MPPTQRIFLAINLPAAERRAIHDATSPLREAAAGVAWVAEEKLHLTLKFLGGLPAASVDALRGALAPALVGEWLAPDRLRALRDAVRGAGFARAALDLRGFRSGSLNVLAGVRAE